MTLSSARSTSRPTPSAYSSTCGPLTSTFQPEVVQFNARIRRAGRTAGTPTVDLDVINNRSQAVVKHEPPDPKQCIYRTTFTDLRQGRKRWCNVRFVRLDPKSRNPRPTDYRAESGVKFLRRGKPSSPPARRPGKRCKLPPVGSGAKPQPHELLGAFYCFLPKSTIDQYFDYQSGHLPQLVYFFFYFATICGK